MNKYKAVTVATTNRWEFSITVTPATQTTSVERPLVRGDYFESPRMFHVLLLI